MTQLPADLSMRTVIFRLHKGFYDKNVFSYCENDPVNRVDTEGDFWLLGVIGAAVGAIVGGVSKSCSECLYRSSFK